MGTDGRDSRHHGEHQSAHMTRREPHIYATASSLRIPSSGALN